MIKRIIRWAFGASIASLFLAFLSMPLDMLHRGILKYGLWCLVVSVALLTLTLLLVFSQFVIGTVRPSPTPR